MITELLQDVALILMSSMLLSLGFMSFGQPPLLGYILAGTLIGPSFVQVIENTAALHTLGEFGLILLLFLVGLEINIEDFKKVWAQTLVFLGVQIVGCMGLAFLCQAVFGWPIEFTILTSFVLVLSSTAVVITLLENLGILQSKSGSFAVSVLIAQDLSLIPMILILRALSSTNANSGSLINLLVALLLLIFCVIYFGKNITDSYSKLQYRNILKRPEITTLIGGSVCFAFAALSEIFNLSAAYGSFLAGLMLGNRWDREPLIKAFIPITSMMMMIFFLSVGLRVSLNFIAYNIWPIILILCGITLIKFIINSIGLWIVRWPWRSNMFLAVLLAQLSEFSFVLIDEAHKTQLINYYSNNFFISLITLSLAFGSILPLLVKHSKKS